MSSERSEGSPSPETNPATALAWVLVDELARCGLREAVIAPGSRSTPLALALAADGRIRLHVRIDERSASFLALGLARRQGHPVAVVCTSGTAAANFHPAVLESDRSGVPLLVLTADRPPELRDTGANQTVDQLGLYGGAVRWFSEVGVPEAVPGMVAYWRSLAARAWAQARGRVAGPVHLNVAFREPLLPGTHGPQPDSWPEPLAGREDGKPWLLVHEEPNQAGALTLPEVERGVIVCGDGDYDPEPYLELSAATGWPLLAEPTSNARRDPRLALSAYRYLLGHPGFIRQNRPDVVVTVGRCGLSRELLAFLRTARRHVAVGNPEDVRRLADPVRTATDVVSAVVAPGGCDPDSAWSRSWRRADAHARQALDEVLDTAEPSEPRLARDLAAALPAGSLLTVGASMPIRDLDAAMYPRTGLRLLGNRGVSGIDGTVSTALGAALAHQAAGGGPAAALVGDLALLHDQNGLIRGPEEPDVDLCLVVVNNDGGGIFSELEQASHPDFERLFGTPHGVSPERVAQMAGIEYTLLEEPEDLPKHVVGSGVRLLEFRTRRAASAEVRRRLRAAVQEAVG
ncbi:2-succinyl-5-enolpyruvyl-6-hydroxy-3-cyclohexene-1-carboxylic-acid synthase [Lipingzhangella sp. LS1_29]|uniref:2-succinyl-5-enolpyruvyl-6-hydroxy-3-cyclohexene-1-carboxylate synthase n=1 Tax=Lipingzhangella rawalii TaxID=2055835 RepID=A0ABU2H1N5_9ACTN|nr:2-succinyl-5-enolpyruvyl-6-hydroxy-3-cyclohexene-1-carboxylic-acid synthase [Lipingzhangella rawalii]MDS1269204.1 2-succinyl-5-enolpyruvyl-6-hydroxy-3-cyclohexene-1-carboxylic-acid synthase [Lipingzhangella rawalii]